MMKSYSKSPTSLSSSLLFAFVAVRDLVRSCSTCRVCRDEALWDCGDIERSEAGDVRSMVAGGELPYGHGGNVVESGACAASLSFCWAMS